ncbi:MAG TPA: chemotaxis protein CheW [Stellaceae bacterium]|jgi:purine-binding chemotaxis protein CheW|nr:chemotaxis protein CheW [Stellaceae bacterium]
MSALNTANADSKGWLICRAGGRQCALPLAEIVETMRVLPIRPIAGAPAFVSGASIIRGSLVPVIHLAALIGERETIPRRLMTIEVGARLVGLAASEVLGVRTIDQGVSEELPPLLRDAGGDVVRAIRVLDGELLLILEASRLVSDDSFATLDAALAAS